MSKNRVKVGGLYYDVIVSSEPLLLNNKRCKGLIDYEQTTIKLADDEVHNKQQQEQTFFHELVHALRHSRNIEWGDNDELYTDEIGIALHAFFVDNGIEIPIDVSEGKDKFSPKAAKGR